MASQKSCSIEEPVTVVIPAFNEEKTIGEVINGVFGAVPEARVLVIDDGSTDSTARVAERSGATVISHPLNKGNGACLKTALRAINGGLVAVIDADGQHNPSDLPKLLSRLNEYDLVVGCRTFDKESGSQLRNLGNVILTRLSSFLAEREIPDLTSGFRAFRHDIACKFIHIYPNGYSFPSTSSLSFLMSGYNVDFIPVEVNRRESGTHSKLRPFSDGFKFLMLILRIITLANPNRLFFPAGLFMVLMGVVITVRNLILFQQFSSGAVLFLAGGFNTIFFGLILDQFASLRLREHE